MTEELSDKKTGVALAWLGTLGPLGAHRLYLGRWLSGLLLGGIMVALIVWSVFGGIEYYRAAAADEPLVPPILALLLRMGLVAVWGLWCGVDLWLISTGRMRDGRGRLLEPRER